MEDRECARVEFQGLDPRGNYPTAANREETSWSVSDDAVYDSWKLDFAGIISSFRHLWLGRSRVWRGGRKGEQCTVLTYGNEKVEEEREGGGVYDVTTACLRS